MWRLPVCVVRCGAYGAWRVAVARRGAARCARSPAGGGGSWWWWGPGGGGEGRWMALVFAVEGWRKGGGFSWVV